MFRHACFSLLLLSLATLPLAADHAPGVKNNGPAVAVLRWAGSGPWSAATTWEGGKVPGAGARVLIRTGHRVVYDVQSDVVIRAVNVAGTLSFAADRDTRLDVGLI